MPVIRIDRIRIQEVWVNLIENAIKYAQDNKPVKIKIGCTNTDDQNVFYIQDNGIGILSRYHDKVFGLFNQLNPDIDGTGVGLSIVQRIIEFHGGKIWLESEGEYKGSTFYFTIG